MQMSLEAEEDEEEEQNEDEKNMENLTKRKNYEEKLISARWRS